ncbi:hypothetical protein YPPY89_2242, partial [Yersinia pestis PY-89]
MIAIKPGFFMLNINAS